MKHRCLAVAVMAAFGCGDSEKNAKPVAEPVAVMKQPSPTEVDAAAPQLDAADQPTSDTSWRAPQGGALTAEEAEYQQLRQRAIEEARKNGVLGAGLLQGGASAAPTGPGNVPPGHPGHANDGARSDGRGARSRSVPLTKLGEPSCSGDLDKAIVRQYIKRNLIKIQYCYERELLAKESLEGRVNAEFTIGVSGVVTDTSASGVDPTVASCVQRVLEDIEFPKPAGGVVTCSNAIDFRPSGG